MFWGRFNYDEIGSLLPIEEMINTEKYINVVEKKMVADLANASPDELIVHDGRKLFQLFKLSNSRSVF